MANKFAGGADEPLGGMAAATSPSREEDRSAGVSGRAARRAPPLELAKKTPPLGCLAKCCEEKTPAGLRRQENVPAGLHRENNAPAGFTPAPAGAISSRVAFARPSERVFFARRSRRHGKKPATVPLRFN